MGGHRAKKHTPSSLGGGATELVPEGPRWGEKQFHPFKYLGTATELLFVWGYPNMRLLSDFHQIEFFINTAAVRNRVLFGFCRPVLGVVDWMRRIRCVDDEKMFLNRLSSLYGYLRK